MNYNMENITKLNRNKNLEKAYNKSKLLLRRGFYDKDD